jgi:hypothetical protein
MLPKIYSMNTRNSESELRIMLRFLNVLVILNSCSNFLMMAGFKVSKWLEDYRISYNRGYYVDIV